MLRGSRALRIRPNKLLVRLGNGEAGETSQCEHDREQGFSGHELSSLGKWLTAGADAPRFERWLGPETEGELPRA